MKTSLIIGRFQPFHLGHLKLIEIAAENSDRLVIGIGSSQEGNTRENPFTSDERKEMIKNSLSIKIPYEIIPIPDINNNKLWVPHVKKLVPEFDAVYTNGELERRLFKDAGIPVVSTRIFNRDYYSGTEIRRRILSGEKWEDLVPKGTSSLIKRIKGVERIRSIG
jgi:nicotinamide-nucleotide adenylyltransferase